MKIWTPAEHDNTIMVEINRVMFADDDGGDRKYEKYETRYNALKNGKKKLISKLLMSADKEMKDSLTTHPDYKGFYQTYNLLGIWNLAEEVAVGRGAISIYSLITRLLEHKQEGAYTSYEKEFKEMVIDLVAQGTADQVLQKIFNALFILGLNEVQFKDKLAIIYGEKD